MNGVRDIIKTLRLAKWRWAANTARINDNRWTYNIMDWQQGQGLGKEVDREEEGEMTSGFMKEQHGQ